MRPIEEDCLGVERGAAGWLGVALRPTLLEELRLELRGEDCRPLSRRYAGASERAGRELLRLRDRSLPSWAFLAADCCRER